jgi:general secretion pathway protein I
MPGPMRGFTLLEVLIALVVVAVTLAAATAAIGGAARRQRGLEERTFATWAAHNALGRLRLEGFAGEATQVEQTQAGQRLQIDVQVRAGETLRRVELAVRRPGEAEPVARLTGFLPAAVQDGAPPSPSQPAGEAAADTPNPSRRSTP